MESPFYLHPQLTADTVPVGDLKLSRVLLAKDANFPWLILPFSDGGTGVTRIMSSFEFVCEDGSYDAASLVGLQHGAPSLRLCAMIQAQQTTAAP